MYHDIPGDGGPIVFLHGLGCASSCDYPVVASHLSAAGRRMVLIDLFGSGFSDRPVNFDYTVESHAEVVALLISKIGPDSIDLFGHSMGGAIAIATAARLGQKVRRLALGEPNLDPGGGMFSRKIASTPENDYIFRGHKETVDAARANGNLIWASSLDRSAAFAIHREAASLVAGSTPTWRDLLYRMTIPKTVIFGARSLPSADFEQLPHHACAVEVVADAGHSMAWDNPSGLAAALRTAFC